MPTKLTPHPHGVVRLVSLQAQAVCEPLTMTSTEWAAFENGVVPPVANWLVVAQFVLDTGDALKPLEPQETVIPAAEWETYSTERFPREIAQWQERLDAMPADEVEPVKAKRPSAHRRKQRAK